MTAYESACKAACRWCAEGSPVVQFESKPHHQLVYAGLDEDETGFEPCKAPTKDQVMEQQAARIEELVEALKCCDSTMEVVAKRDGFRCCVHYNERELHDHDTNCGRRIARRTIEAEQR